MYLTVSSHLILSYLILLVLSSSSSIYLFIYFIMHISTVFRMRYNIVSHLIVSHFILSYLILLYLNLWYLAMFSDLIVSHWIFSSFLFSFNCTSSYLITLSYFILSVYYVYECVCVCLLSIFCLWHNNIRAQAMAQCGRCVSGQVSVCWVCLWKRARLTQAC